MYPVTWPELVPTIEARCALPNGLFENTVALSRYEYADSYQYPPPTLAGVFGATSFVGEITHLRLETLPQGGLRVTGFGVENSHEVQLSEAVVEEERFECRSGRWSIKTDATRWGWNGLQDAYDPTLMAAYLVGTFGVIMPMSRWWNFVFAKTVDGSLALRRLNMESAVMLMVFYGRSAMNDDWFLYLPTDAERAIEQATARPEAAVGVAPEAIRRPPGKTVDCAAPCFTAAAEHPQGAHKEAMWYLCVMYEQGWGVDKHLATAKQWCKRAQSAAAR